MFLKCDFFFPFHTTLSQSKLKRFLVPVAANVTSVGRSESRFLIWQENHLCDSGCHGNKIEDATTWRPSWPRRTKTSQDTKWKSDKEQKRSDWNMAKWKDTVWKINGNHTQCKDACWRDEKSLSWGGGAMAAVWKFTNEELRRHLKNEKRLSSHTKAKRSKTRPSERKTMKLSKRMKVSNENPSHGRRHLCPPGGDRCSVPRPTRCQWAPFIWILDDYGHQQQWMTWTVKRSSERPGGWGEKEDKNAESRAAMERRKMRWWTVTTSKMINE